MATIAIVRKYRHGVLALSVFSACEPSEANSQHT